jgi:hypothetical protein
MLLIISKLNIKVKVPPITRNIDIKLIENNKTFKVVVILLELEVPKAMKKIIAIENTMGVKQATKPLMKAKTNILNMVIMQLKWL